jgi:hypothetical protein
MTRYVPLLGLVLATASCRGTTGDELLTFPAYAEGARGASQPFSTNGYSVQLTAAQMRIGAVYFLEAPPLTGFDGPSCIAPSLYAAQVPGPIELELLSSQPQEFSVIGNGTADTALSWQLWLTDGDVNAANAAHIADLQGVATRSDGMRFAFGAVVTINTGNRLGTASDPAQPGLNPICTKRILQIGSLDVTFYQGGTVNVTVDPRAWFSATFDFSTLPLVASCLSDDPVVPLSVSDFGPPVCVAGLGAGACPTDAQYNPVDCPTPESPCELPKHCIPDTNFATGQGSEQGEQLFTGMYNAGPAAYSLSYSRSP